MIDTIINVLWPVGMMVGRRTTVKHAGVLSRETLQGLRRLSRKLGYYSSREDVWHLLDTVEAQQLVLDRLLDGWSVPMSSADHLLGYWTDDRHRPGEYRGPEEMSQAEQLIVYDRVVRPEAPAWPS